MYRVITTKRFEKEFEKIDRQIQKKIKIWILKNLEGTRNPRLYGKRLVGNRKNQWRYRIGDYRIIVQIKDKELIILALEVGHRKDIYC